MVRATLWWVSGPAERRASLVESAGERRQAQIRRRDAQGVPRNANAWPSVVKEVAVGAVARMASGALPVEDGSKLVAACERALRMLEGAPVGPGAGRPAKGAVARSVSDPVFAAQLAELQELVNEQGEVRDAG